MFIFKIIFPDSLSCVINFYLVNAVLKYPLNKSDEAAISKCIEEVVQFSLEQLHFNQIQMMWRKEQVEPPKSSC